MEGRKGKEDRGNRLQPVGWPLLHRRNHPGCNWCHGGCSMGERRCADRMIEVALCSSLISLPTHCLTAWWKDTMWLIRSLALPSVRQAMNGIMAREGVNQ